MIADEVPDLFTLLTARCGSVEVEVVSAKDAVTGLFATKGG